MSIIWRCLGQSDGQLIDIPVVSATKMNILYKGIDNPISIAVPNISCSDLHVTVANGTLTGGDCKYSINPDKVGLAYIIIMTIKDKDTTVLGKSEFRVNYVPFPVATLCGRSNEIDKEQVLNCRGLVLRFKDICVRPSHKVTQYDLVVIEGDCITKRLTSTQAKLTDEMKDALKRIEPGDIIVFENIKAINPNETITLTDLAAPQEHTTSLPGEPIDINDLRLIVK